MWYPKVPPHMTADPRLDALAFRIGVAILRYAHADGTHCTASSETIAKAASTSKDMVRRKLAEFKGTIWEVCFDPKTGARIINFLPGVYPFDQDEAETTPLPAPQKSIRSIASSDARGLRRVVGCDAESQGTTDDGRGVIRSVVGGCDAESQGGDTLGHTNQPVTSPLISPRISEDPPSPRQEDPEQQEPDHVREVQADVPPPGRDGVGTAQRPEADRHPRQETLFRGADGPAPGPGGAVAGDDRQDLPDAARCGPDLLPRDVEPPRNRGPLPDAVILDGWARVVAACPPGGVQVARKIGKDLRSHINARMQDESDPAGIWDLVCSYLPLDDWHSGRSPRTDGRAWRCSLAYAFSPKGWQQITERAETWRQEAEAIEADRQAQAEKDARTAEEYQRAEKARAEREANPAAAAKWAEMRERLDRAAVRMAPPPGIAAMRDPDEPLTPEEEAAELAHHTEFMAKARAQLAAAIAERDAK